MHLDLHLHTTCSDGLLSPESLVQAARRAGLTGIAVTDHDTTSGVERARQAAREAGGLLVIPGVELTTSRDGVELHLLGYGVDPKHQSLAEFTSRASLLRRERVGRILARLRALGVSIADHDVTVEPGCVSVGRPHVAQALVRLGAAGSVQDAFNRWLADGAPAFEPSRGPDVAVGIQALHASGALAVWAHPVLEDARHFGTLAALGLDGIETLRPSVDPAVSLALEQEARSIGLLVTGGSDWHGQTRPALGSFYVTEKHVGAFLARLGVPVD